MGLRCAGPFLKRGVGMFDLRSILVSGLVSSLSAIIAVVGLHFWYRRQTARTVLEDGLSKEDGIVFLFDDRTLVDATPKARAQIPNEPVESDDWGRFTIAFSKRFERLDDKFRAVGPDDLVEILEVPEDPDSLRLVASEREGMIRIALIDPLQDHRSELLEHYSLAAMRAELSTLRSVAEQSPSPTWKQRSDGTIIWANSSYMALARETIGENALFGWPPPDIFAGTDISSLSADAAHRVSVPAPTGQDSHWFDLTVVHGEIENLCFAVPVDKLVRAESSLSEFVQTLTKTFAHLTIGLAIFDRKRQLALFNPALVDLTGLPPEQLSGRPSLHSFLDALRDRQRIPEPKDYKSWRLHIAQLEAGAANGTYEEVWNLPSGETYRVTGRPHPDGAVAYVFEDISSEVSMTRNFRSEIEISQAVLDNLDTAVAAFTREGILTVSNRAYAQMWKADPDNGLSATSLTQASRQWRSMCTPSQAWEDLFSTILRSGERPPWSSTLKLQNGPALRCDIRPLSGGGTLVSFHPILPPEEQVPASGPGRRAIA